MSKTRLERLGAALRSANLDAVAINPGPALTYLTGVHFHLMERPVVLLAASGATPALVLPELELAKVAQIPFTVQAFAYPENPAEWASAFLKAAQALGLDRKRIGVEPRQMRLLEFGHVKAAAPGAEFPDASDVLASLRLRKEADEIAAMRQAVKIAQAALESAIPLARVGMTEKELAGELIVQLFRQGSDPELPFSPIVSAGPNSANPHASPTDRKLQAGDMLVVDWGAARDGYFSDLTRTFAVREVQPELETIHRVVQAANEAGRAAARPGVECAAVDRAARAVIEAAGFAAHFTHRTGHGIGIDVHEDPYIHAANTQLLEPGMAFTVEPGIYLPERNGVRIEDNVVITEKGADVLSDTPRELRVIG